MSRLGHFVNKYISGFLIGILLFTFAAFAFFNIFPFNVAEFKSLTIKNQPSVGGIVEYTNEYCQNVGKNTERTLKRFLIAKDKTLINPVELSGSPEDETQVDAGCRTSVPIKLSIPSGIPVGEYKLRVKACYDVMFRVKCITVQGESDYFMVAKPDVNAILESINNQLQNVIPLITVKKVEEPQVQNVTTNETSSNQVQQQKGSISSTIESINSIIKGVGL